LLARARFRARWTVAMDWRCFSSKSFPASRVVPISSSCPVGGAQASAGGPIVEFVMQTSSVVRRRIYRLAPFYRRRPVHDVTGAAPGRRSSSCKPATLVFQSLGFRHVWRSTATVLTTGLAASHAAARRTSWSISQVTRGIVGTPASEEWQRPPASAWRQSRTPCGAVGTTLSTTVPPRGRTGPRRSAERVRRPRSKDARGFRLCQKGAERAPGSRAG
jgi:hypothetical protein